MIDELPAPIMLILTPRLAAYLRRLAEANGKSEAAIIRSMLEEIRVDDERAHTQAAAR